MPEGVTVHFEGIVTAPFAGGDGTEANPYQISTVRQFDAIRNYLSAHFVLVNDIDLYGFYTNIWEPIGSQEDPFTGSLDGAGFSVKNISLANGPYFERFDAAFVTINSAISVGLFSCATDASFKNLNLEIASCNVTGGPYIFFGGLVGYANGCTVDHVRVSGQVLNVTPGTAGRNYYGGAVGGVVGRADSTTITHSHNACDVTVSSNFDPGDSGGITGLGGIIAFSSNSGNISAKGDPIYAGGITGRSATISESYNIGDIVISGNGTSANAGGILGYGGTVTNCYNIGTVSQTNASTSSSVGSIVGSSRYSTISSCYGVATVKHATTSGIEYYIAGVSKTLTEEDMKNQSSYDGFDFDSIWTWGNLSEYPFPELQNNRYTESELNPGEFSISLDKSFIKLTSIGATETLVATVQPVGAEITWSTSDFNVATVDNGVVTAVGVGNAIISASISNGSTAFSSMCTVTVTLSESDLYIIEQVKKYTSDELWAQANDIMLSQESDNVKMQRWHELFTLYGFTDVNEGTKYLSKTIPERQAYRFLTTDEIYVAYHTWNYLRNL